MSPVLASLLVAISANPASEPALNTEADTLVVCPAGFRDALQPWLALRRGQGHRIKLMTNLGTPEEIRAEIRKSVPGGLRFVLLVGGADPKLYSDSNVRARSVPMHYAKARINVKWGSTPTIPTDNWYVQSDAEGGEESDQNPVPSLAIGRLPATSAEELKLMVKKIVAYERSEDFGPWRQRINFVAGVGNFGFMVDSILETAATTFLTENIPAEYHVSMTYGNWRSPYCPDPRRFHAETIQRLDEGSLFWIYMGHSGTRETARMQVPGREYPILSTLDASALRGSQGRPIALFLSCLAGALDARGQCLAGGLAGSPGGPVAVVAATRVTMPYAMTIMATNLSDELFRGHCETLGEALMNAKQNMLKTPKKADSRRAMIDAVAAIASPSPREMAAERAEHVLMFNLIGDPLLSLRHPQPIEIRLAKTAPTGGSLQIDFTSPIDGRATVELVLRRDRLRGPRSARNVYPANADELAAFNVVYRRANDRCLNSVEMAVSKGHFEAKIDVPSEALGACAVCVCVAGNSLMALGSAPLEVVPSAEIRPVSVSRRD
jgi:hypothetical protein